MWNECRTGICSQLSVVTGTGPWFAGILNKLEQFQHQVWFFNYSPGFELFGIHEIFQCLSLLLSYSRFSNNGSGAYGPECGTMFLTSCVSQCPKSSAAIFNHFAQLLFIKWPTQYKGISKRNQRMPADHPERSGDQSAFYLLQPQCPTRDNFRPMERRLQQMWEMWHNTCVSFGKWEKISFGKE